MNRTVRIYLCLTFGIAWTLWIVCIHGIGSPAAIQLASAAAMWAPGISVLLTAGFTHTDLHVREMLKPDIRHHSRAYAFAWFVPAALTLTGGCLYYLVFRNQFDSSLSYVTMTLAQYGAAMNPAMYLLNQVIAMVTCGPLINSLLAVGEELGWRGFLYPQLKHSCGTWKAHLLCGFIWGFWHTPLNMTGYNYGTAYAGFPLAGILAMSVFCFSAGVLSSYLYEKTGTIWPSAVFHGAINACGAFPLLFQKTGFINQHYTLLGPGINGILTGLPMLVIALIILRKEVRP